jgi:hypothetical protein
LKGRQRAEFDGGRSSDDGTRCTNRYAAGEPRMVVEGGGSSKDHGQ